MDKQFDLLLSPPGTVYWRDEQEEEERARERGGAGEGKQNQRREREKRVREGETERIRDPVGGGMKGWRWRDKYGNKKKRRQIAPVVSTCTGEAFPLISGLFVCLLTVSLVFAFFSPLFLSSWP